MSTKLTELMLRNWPLKLAALFLALLLYVAVAAEQPINQTFTERLVVRVPPGRALLSTPPIVSVVVEGRGGELLKLRALPRSISVTVPDTASGNWHFFLRPADIGMPAGVSVQVIDIYPREITVTLDSVSRKDVRIVPRITVTGDSGAILRGGLVISPSLARVVGPDRALAAIESVTTVPTAITNVMGGFTRSVPLDTMDLGMVRVAPREVQVSGELVALAKRVFGGIAVETGAGAPTGFVFAPSHVSVEIQGTAERLQGLTRDSVKVFARFAAGATDGASVHLTVLAPSGVAAHAVPDSAVLKRKTGHE